MANVQANITVTVRCASGSSSEENNMNPIAPLSMVTVTPRSLGCTVSAQRIIAA
jgi:hypothetical protein